MKMKNSPILLSILFTLLAIVFPTIAGVIIAVKNISSLSSITLIQFIAFAVGILVTLWIMKKSKFSFQDFGFRKFKAEAWMAVIVISELIAFFNGITDKEGFSAQYVLILFLFVIAVGLFEEFIFRGLILKYLSAKGLKVAIIGSSILFGIGHLANILSGADLLMTLLQITYAFLFGLVCAEIVAKTKSIIFPIVWHAMHDFIAFLTDSEPNVLAVSIYVFHCIVLIGLAIYFWRALFPKKAVMNLKNPESYV
ncbi:CPBP family intramembrane glutamic endopeptidase [Lysinibacillus xylanilyticus]|uniref:CPBP family intramembrane metalloprotease n=1 Tax=Lysinibacillus xylanilyticus TaxID=582475 RepID=A0A2M9Q3B1_9BACI|nr:type II CAAX endopeptidase family protein [Lysinibacillus xylanilyticus]PJO42452.1 CPBP family intramembrane metalloprotease [Lysinibacillus xylanilyticus]